MVAIKSELQELRTWIGGLSDVSSGPHRFGGVEFTVDGLEFMHFHGETHLDIRLSKSDQEKVLVSAKAERHRFAPDAGWVTFRIKSSEDVKTVKEVIQLAYDHASATMKQHTARRQVAK
jgi:hypothetical protein